MVEELFISHTACYFIVNIIFIHAAHAHEWAFTHVDIHTATRGWPEDQWTSSPAFVACAWFHPPLPSLPAAVAAQLPAAAGKGTKAAFVVSLQLHYESCPAAVSGTLGLACPPVQMLMNWDIVLISFSPFCILCCMCSLSKKTHTFKRWLSLSFLQLISFVSWNRGHALLRMQLKLFIIFVG